MKLENFYNGWIIGNFNPSIIKTDVLDVGVLDIPSNHTADGHYHKKHVEYNLILIGEAIINDKKYVSGDFFVFNPNEKSFVFYPVDTKLLVIKAPSTKNDKYYD